MLNKSQQMPLIYNSAIIMDLMNSLSFITNHKKSVQNCWLTLLQALLSHSCSQPIPLAFFQFQVCSPAKVCNKFTDINVERIKTFTTDNNFSFSLLQQKQKNVVVVAVCCTILDRNLNREHGTFLCLYFPAIPFIPSRVDVIFPIVFFSFSRAEKNKHKILERLHAACKVSNGFGTCKKRNKKNKNPAAAENAGNKIFMSPRNHTLWEQHETRAVRTSMEPLCDGKHRQRTTPLRHHHNWSRTRKESLFAPSQFTKIELARFPRMTSIWVEFPTNCGPHCWQRADRENHWNLLLLLIRATFRWQSDGE